MPSIEVIEVLNLIMTSIAIGIFSIAVVKVKKLAKYLPAFITLWIAFLSTNMEAIINPEQFNFMEHLMILMTGILMLIAVFYDFFNAFLKQKLRLEEGKR